MALFGGMVCVGLFSEWIVTQPYSWWGVAAGAGLVALFALIVLRAVR